MPSDQRALELHLKQALLVGLGVWLIITALQFAGLSETVTSSTKADRATIGAVIGAGVGIGTYLLIGGIGVATGGIGFALGAVALTALGTGAGALTGAATGQTTVYLYDYPTWLWIGLILMGCTVLYAAYGSLRHFMTSAGRNAPEAAERSSLPMPKLPLSARVVAILLVGVLVGTYVSTLTERRPPPAPVFENVVFIDNGKLNRMKEQALWWLHKKQMTSKWSGHYLQAGDKTFRAVDGKWQEQPSESK